MADYVFDASALLAIAFSEPGAEVALSRMSGASISTVNYSEAGAKMIDKGFTVGEAFRWLDALRLDIVAFDRDQAESAAGMRLGTRLQRLSFADRACIGLARAREATAITTDRVWSTLDLGCKIELIR